MSTTKFSISYYLSENGYKDFRIKKIGDFIHVSLWDIVTFDEVKKIKEDLNKICGKVSDPKFFWLDVLELHCGNVRFDSAKTVRD